MAEQWGCLILFLLCLTINAQSVTDLGVMTPNRMIYLERDTNRSDFSHFFVQLQACAWPSNFMSFSTTNQALTIDNMIAMPPGPTVMGVYSVHLDGATSPMALFRFDLRRDGPSPPKARSVAILKPNYAHSLSNQIRVMRERPVQPPPMPGQTNRVMAAEPLPGNGETYESFVLRQRARMAQEKRRNQ